MLDMQLKGEKKMEGEQRERWWQLCAQAADERDPAKLMKLVEEITRLLEQKQGRLTPQKPEKPSA